MKLALLLALGGLNLGAQVSQPVDDPTADLADSSVYEPLTLGQRFQWAAKAAVSPRRFGASLITSAIQTWRNNPEEYGPHWEGWGKRIGLRASQGATGLMLETAIGSLWSEDPRYVRATGRPMKSRVLNIVKMAFMARDREGKLVPAYARFIAIPANSYLGNAWRPDSQATFGRATWRIPITFSSRMASNAFSEFTPELKKLLRRH